MPSYVPILILGGVVVGFAVFTLFVSQLLGKARPNPQKSAVYECGVPAIGTARERFPIKFYLVAMLFIVFDIETVFLYPWAVTYRSKGGSLMLFNLVEMVVFIAILFVGYIYVWKRGALEWR